MGISGSDAGVSVCGRAQLHLCQRFPVEHAAVGLRHPTIRDGDRHQGRRAPQTVVSVLLLLGDCRGKGTFHFKQIICPKL